MTMGSICPLPLTVWTPRIWLNRNSSSVVRMNTNVAIGPAIADMKEFASSQIWMALESSSFANSESPKKARPKHRRDTLNNIVRIVNRNLNHMRAPWNRSCRGKYQPFMWHVPKEMHIPPSRIKRHNDCRVVQPSYPSRYKETRQCNRALRQSMHSGSHSLFVSRNCSRLHRRHLGPFRNWDLQCKRIALSNILQHIVDH